MEFKFLKLRDLQGKTPVSYTHLENTAPRGQRNWQKNLSLSIIPTTISNNSTTPVMYAPSLKFLLVIRENTVHGLYFVTYSPFPKKQNPMTQISTIYFNFCK